MIVYQYFTSYSKLGIAVSAEEFLLDNIGTIAITVLMILCIATIFICTYTYGNFLMQNVYKSYLAGERLPYRKNLYFSGKHFRTYIGILGWISLYLLAPILVGLILIVPFGILAKTTLGLSALVVGWISLILFVALVVWFMHLAIRLTFSYFILLYSEEVVKAKTYIRESFRLTRGKVWKIVFLILPFLLVLGIIAGLLQTGEEILSENRVYGKLIEIQKQSEQDDHKLLEGFFDGNEDDRVEFGKIENAFLATKSGINKNFLSASMDYIDIKSIDPHWWMITSIFVILSFLVFEGLASIASLSVYRIISEGDQKRETPDME